jgi:hypothetical protein
MIDSVKINIKRNLEGIPFGPSGPTKQTRDEILKKVTEIQERFENMADQEFAGKSYILSEMTINDKKVLGNISYTINEDTNIDDENFLKAASLDKDWPDGRAIFVNADNSF